MAVLFFTFYDPNGNEMANNLEKLSSANTPEHFTLQKQLLRCRCCETETFQKKIYPKAARQIRK